MERYSYKIVYQGGEGEIVEKKSRFIAHVFPVTKEEQALEYLETLKKQYWDARHNCYAYVIGEKQQLQRFSDDGEPSGTAGKPILEVLLGEDIHNTLVVVTRYFGGILLGTGGLTRAYTKGASMSINNAGIIEKVKGVKLSIDINYDLLGKVQYLCTQNNWYMEEVTYEENVRFYILAEESIANEIEQEITNTTNALAHIKRSDEGDYFKEENRLYAEI